MFSKGAFLPSILFIGSVSLLTACSQNSPQRCALNDPTCDIPSPPREHAKATEHKNMPSYVNTKEVLSSRATSTEVQVNDIVASDNVEPAASDQLIPAEEKIKTTASHSTSGLAAQRANVQVIEHIRQSKSTVHTKAIYSLPKVETASKTTNIASNAAYTIQLGAYRKASSRHHAIKQFPDESELLLFTMRNDLLGLSYGQFKTLSEVKAQKTWLLEQGITDFVFRRLPRNAQPLN